MSTPILATKLYTPPHRAKLVQRSALLERLNDGAHHKLTLVSAPAGFGKTTLISEWIASGDRPTAWLSLDESDNDPNRFLTYLIAALQTISSGLGEGLLALLRTPQPPPAESILTALLNEIGPQPDHFTLVLDDYHVIDAKSINDALAFLVDHLPPQMHLVIATREDPQLPLARLRARGQLTELRVTDLRFTLPEAAGFLNQVMNLKLSAEDVSALENRTEGWIAGLQLAAISMQGHQDASSFIKSFTGSHRFVLDYLIEEVFQQQPENIQTFLLSTAILDRMCGPLCDAILPDSNASGQEMLGYIEQANLFIIPLDNDRQWYRYHHLFAELLRQRLHQSLITAGDQEAKLNDLHLRASKWYENNGLEVEAFQHAAAAHDIDQAVHLIESKKGMPLYFRGAAAPVLNWLKSLHPEVLDSKPNLWVMYASTLLFVSQVSGIEQKLLAAEAAIQNFPLDEKMRDTIGHIALIRATLAVIQHDLAAIITQSQRALEYLHPHNLPVRTASIWTLGYARHLEGDRPAAHRAYSEAIATSEAIGHFIITVMSTIGLANIQELDLQLALAAKNYQHVLDIIGELPLPVACEAHLGLARLCYEWNDLDAAEEHAQQSIRGARQLETTDRIVANLIFFARLKLTRGDIAGAGLLLAEADQVVRQHHFIYRIPEIIDLQVITLLSQDKVTAAAQLLKGHDRPVSQARILLAQGNTSAALDILAPVRQEAEAKAWADEQLKLMILQALVYDAAGDSDTAVKILSEALAAAEPAGFIRLFVDEGPMMARLLSKAAARGIMPDYTARLLAAFEADEQNDPDKSTSAGLIEPLSQRELEVLRLIAQGLSNREISEQLFLALITVKGHNQKIFAKLQAQRRTEAVARARELGLL